MYSGGGAGAIFDLCLRLTPAAAQGYCVPRDASFRQAPRRARSLPFNRHQVSLSPVFPLPASSATGENSPSPEQPFHSHGRAHLRGGPGPTGVRVRVAGAEWAEAAAGVGAPVTRCTCLKSQRAWGRGSNIRHMLYGGGAGASLLWRHLSY